MPARATVTDLTAAPSPFAAWLSATRPKTLAAGLAPVAVGTALAATVGPVQWLPAVLCLVGALLIQVGVNFANDALDAARGADGPDRLGPRRAVASGLISARAMLTATAIVLGLAFAVGLWLCAWGGWPILVLGVVSLVCAIAYTGGPWPLAYHGLGDCFVLLFFGLFAVLGSAWVQVAASTAALPAWWWAVAAAVGCQATAILCVNNLRDIVGDARVGKRTLAVRLGEDATRWYYAGLHAAAVALIATAAWAAPAHGRDLAVAAVVAGAAGAVLSLHVMRIRGAELNAALARTAACELITALALVAGLMS